MKEPRTEIGDRVQKPRPCTDAIHDLAEKPAGHGLCICGELVTMSPSRSARRISHVTTLEENIGRRIFMIRGHKVMLDADLADVYRVKVKRLNEQVKRNRCRFPLDFMFQLTAEETAALRSQFATSNPNRGGRRHRPHVFTEHGAVMVASVLKSATAIGASILVVRAFVRLRMVLAAHRDLERRLNELQKKYDGQFRAVFDAIRQLMQPPLTARRRRIGFEVPHNAALPERRSRGSSSRRLTRGSS